MSTKIDLNTKKTELQWQETIDSFWKKVTPLWFDWLQWVLVLGVIGYIAQESRSTALAVCYEFSYIALFFYLQGLFFSIEFQGLPLLKSKRAQRITSFVLSGLLSLAIWFFLARIISELRGKV
jgi:hypothetical protein